MLNGKHSSVDAEATENWHETVAPILKQYMPQNIFTVNETALF
jgi:hypothetical protein